MATTTTAAATSSFLGTRLPEVHSSSGRVQARFGFGPKKAPKKIAKRTSDRPLWYPGAIAPDYLDGSLVGDYGFDPFGLGKPAEYLQFELDSLDQNLAKNVAGDIIGTRTEVADVKSTPFQPYNEVFGLQRFRECELIHGRWAMLATLGALAVEWLTGVTWQDAGKVPLPAYVYNTNALVVSYFLVACAWLEPILRVGNKPLTHNFSVRIPIDVGFSNVRNVCSEVK